jgi:hypothetical protein
MNDMSDNTTVVLCVAVIGVLFFGTVAKGCDGAETTTRTRLRYERDAKIECIKRHTPLDCSQLLLRYQVPQ